MHKKEEDKIKTLSDLDKKISKYQDINSLKEKDQKEAESLLSYAKIGLSVITEFISGVIVSVIIGILIDRYFDTSPIFLILFIFVGFVAGIRNIYKYINKEL